MIYYTLTGRPVEEPGRDNDVFAHPAAHRLAPPGAACWRALKGAALPVCPATSRFLRLAVAQQHDRGIQYARGHSCAAAAVGSSARSVPIPWRSTTSQVRLTRFPHLRVIPPSPARASSRRSALLSLLEEPGSGVARHGRISGQLASSGRAALGLRARP